MHSRNHNHNGEHVAPQITFAVEDQNGRAIGPRERVQVRAGDPMRFVITLKVDGKGTSNGYFTVVSNYSVSIYEYRIFYVAVGPQHGYIKTMQ